MKKGHFTEELPEDLKGLFIFKGNKVIMDKMKQSGHLLAYKDILHSYPYNPRSHSPLIYRLTPQWFLSLDKKNQKGFSVRSQLYRFVKKRSTLFRSGGNPVCPQWSKPVQTGV